VNPDHEGAGIAVIRSRTVKTRLIRIVVVVAAAAGVAALAGCNTVEGLGKDLERGGEKLQDVAR
jgi:predicted small secreted protein